MSSKRAATLAKSALLVLGLVLASMLLRIAMSYGDFPIVMSP